MSIQARETTKKPKKKDGKFSKDFCRLHRTSFDDLNQKLRTRRYKEFIFLNFIPKQSDEKPRTSAYRSALRAFASPLCYDCTSKVISIAKTHYHGHRIFLHVLGADIVWLRG